RRHQPPSPHLLGEKVCDAEGAVGTANHKLPISQAPLPRGGQEAAEVRGGTPSQGKEPALEVDHERGSDLLQLSADGEAADAETGNQLGKLRRELLSREAFSTREDGALRRMSFEADLKAEVQSLESSRRRAPVARGEIARGHERSFPRAEGGLRGPQ